MELQKRASTYNSLLKTASPESISKNDVSDFSNVFNFYHVYFGTRQLDHARISSGVVPATPNRSSACLKKRSMAASKPPFITLRSVDEKSARCKSAVPILTPSTSVRHSRIGAYFATRRKVLITHLT
eukprot:463310-Prymnesium_polylepis.1